MSSQITEKVLNDVTKPILFVTILILVFAWFGDDITHFDVFMQFILVGLPLSFIVFYYFGKQHDGYLYVVSLFLAAISWDLILPPYSVGLDGVISTQALLSGSAVDTFFGTFWQGLGFSGFGLFVMTYIVSFAVLFSVATFVFKMAHKK